MSFAITHRYGAMEANPTGNWEQALVAELAANDPEHPDVSVQHESGWCLTAFASGIVLWENVENDDEPACKGRLSQSELIAAWRDLAAGDIQAVASRITTLTS